jgi:hypothetical protein
MTVLIQEAPYSMETEEATLDILRLRRVMNYFESVYYGGTYSFDKGHTVKGIVA